MLSSILWGWPQSPADTTPPELARMMRRYGACARKIEAGTMGAEFAHAWRQCAACERKLQCREWLDLAPPADMPLFCCNEQFFDRAKAATAP